MIMYPAGQRCCMQVKELFMQGLPANQWSQWLISISIKLFLRSKPAIFNAFIVEAIWKKTFTQT